MRQNESRDAAPDAARLESRNGRRRYRVDEIRQRRPLVCDQSRKRILRRRAGNVGRIELQCDARCGKEYDLYELRSDRRRRRVVGRYRLQTGRQRDRRLARQQTPLPGKRQNAERQRTVRRAPERALYRTRTPVSVHRVELGRSERRAHQRVPVRRTQTFNDPSRAPGEKLEPRRFPRFDRRFGSDGRRHLRSGRTSAPRPLCDASVLRI